MKVPENDHRFSASDVREVADLSYRQLNDWDEKGVLPSSREGDSGWRKFNLREIFVLLVCAEMRKRFGVPIESLKFIQGCMLKNGADHFRAAVEMMSLLHTPVFILTDFETTFAMDQPFDIADSFIYGLGSQDDEAAFAVLKVNPLVNRVLDLLKDPIRIEENTEGYALLHHVRGLTRARSGQEYEILKLVRESAFDRVVIHLKDGQISKAYAHEQLNSMDDAELLDLIKSDDFQDIALKRHGGETVRLHRELTFRLSDPVTGHTQSDRKDPGSRVWNHRKDTK